MKYGFEKELFVYDAEGKHALADMMVPHDACGYLAEARGLPFGDAYEAVGSLIAAEHKARITAQKYGQFLETHGSVVLPAKFRKNCLRRFGKNASQELSLTGKYLPQGPRSYAGLHVHFSNEIELQEGRRKRKVSGFINVPKVIVALDKRFAADIREARRVPGLYEIKPYGFEYRSLPADIDPWVVAAFISQEGLGHY